MNTFGDLQEILQEINAAISLFGTNQDILAEVQGYNKRLMAMEVFSGAFTFHDIQRICRQRMQEQLPKLLLCLYQDLESFCDKNGT